ncbi:MAG: type II toxin-antitoxin system HicA family toxin [Thermoanaerobaculales bacterium]
MTEYWGVKGAELLRKLRRIGRSRGVRVSLVRERGRGSHATVYYGDRPAVVPNLKHELKTGTLNGILKQLGLERDDLKG